ncbi:MAG TPA: phosphorylase [Acidobacteriaceae bacterium]|jgi:adenosylhomocysteine nucleosidase|nr:phosphorylase [Acidobacteriaceae bacterium]
MTRVALIAALPSELKPLVRTWEHRDGLYHGRLGEREAVALAAGMGAAAVTRACASALAAGPVDTLISIGYAGSLSCGLQVGGSYAVREVVDAATGERFLSDYPQGHRLITLGSIAGPAEKRQLALKYQAVMVDMEAAAVARFARARNLGFCAFKAITDGPSDQLPDFARFTGADGRLRMPALLAWAAVHPRSWRALRRLGRNSNLAAQQLAFFVPRCLADWR